jgi:hypothetical protein
VGTRLDRDPGRYVVRLSSARDAHVEERIVDLRAGDDEHLTMPWSNDPGAKAEEPAATPPETIASPGAASRRRALAWISTGVGGAALVGSAVSAAVFEVALDEVRSGCPDYQRAACPRSLAPASDRGHLEAALVDVLLPLGALGVAGGAILLVTGKAASPPRVSLAIAPSFVSATWEF